MMNPIAALLYFLSVTIESTHADESLKRIKKLLRSAAPALHINDQDIQTCGKRNLEKDCHSNTTDGRCVFCPDPLMLDSEDDEIQSRGACYPAAIYGLACPRERLK
mmetsp:Transcript_11259/g.18607  ORF Transcript_11259/g.18607 Transcript_11259/m.18607 type:complete len:106 (+) Transcript_11259:317-634(+)